MESGRSKNRRNKNHLKQKAKASSDNVGDSESQLQSPVDRVRPSHLATTPVATAGNIVDMQGALDQGAAEKADEEKNVNKDKKDPNDVGEIRKQKDESNAKIKREDSKDIARCKEGNDDTEKERGSSVEKDQVSQEESKSIEKEEVDERNETEPKKTDVSKEEGQGRYALVAIQISLWTNKYR